MSTQKDIFYSTSVAWSPNGQSLAYCGHDSSITFIQFKGGEASSQTIKNDALPFRDCVFVTDNRLVAVGYDFNPMVYEKKDDVWVQTGNLDDGKQLAEVKKKGNTAAAFKLFTHMTETGKTSAEDKILTKHDNTISCIRKFKANDGATEFSTSGTDGRIHFWNVAHSG